MMISLYKMELLKLFRHRRSYYGLGALLIIEIFIIFGAYHQGNEILNNLLSALNKTFVLQGNLMNGNLVQYIILNSLWFNLPLIVMIIVTGILTMEFKDHTMRTLLLQSVSKRKLIISKYLAAFSYAAISLLLLFLTSVVISYSLFGTGDLVTYLNKLSFIPHEQAIGRIIYSYLSGLVLLFFYAALSLTVAVFFSETITAWIVSALFLILSSLLLKIDMGVLNHWFYAKLTDSWQLFFYYDISWPQVIHNHLLLLFYTLIVAAVGVVSFENRRSYE